MKKVFFLCIALSLILSGCQKKADSDSKEKLAMYNSYYRTVLENTQFEEFSRYYSISKEITDKNGQSVYYVFLDNPQIAMYDVEVIVLEGLLDSSQSDMVPTFGIFDDMEYNMIPYQVNAEKGYVKGIMVSGDLSATTNTLYMMVCWKDKTRLNQTREFIEINLNEIEDETGEHDAVLDDADQEEDSYE